MHTYHTYIQIYYTKINVDAWETSVHKKFSLVSDAKSLLQTLSDWTGA
jgi:TPP-dependent trihydroxycyclohexane-1,2-dione (THcHDO) dehydratase